MELNKNMLLQRIVRFKDEIASGEIASMEMMKKACKTIVLRIEQVLPEDVALLKEWRENLMVIRHTKKTFKKEPERSAGYAFLVEQLGTKEGISNSLAAKIKKGVKDNVIFFHPVENTGNRFYQQQQYQVKAKAPKNGCFNCGGPHYANRCPQGQGFFDRPPHQFGPNPPMPPPFMGGGGRGRGRSGGRGRW